MNKSEVGYLLLMIIANIDHEYHAKEKEIVNNFLGEFLPPIENREKLDSILATYKEIDLEYHFEILAAAFYGLTDEEDRKHFIEYSLQLIQADEHLTVEENKYVSRLFQVWDY